jgi:hypothetical protein
MEKEIIHIKIFNAMFGFGKLLSKFFYICLSLEKLVNGKYFRSTKNTFQLKKNLAWFPEKYFPFILDGKHFPEVFRNVILFADYIKFDPQTFDCYIYILF